MFTSSTHSPCNKTEQCQIKRNSNFHSTEEVKAIKDLIPCLESRREKDNLEPKLRKNWAIQFVDPECSWKLYQEWVNNKTRIVHKAGLGTYGSSHSKLEAHRKEYVKKKEEEKKKPGSQNGQKFHICCSLKWVSAAEKDRDRERSHAKHSPSISSIRSDPRRIIQKFKEEDGEMRENEKNLEDPLVAANKSETQWGNEKCLKYKMHSRWSQ